MKILEIILNVIVVIFGIIGGMALFTVIGTVVFSDEKLYEWFLIGLFIGTVGGMSLAYAFTR